MAYKILNGYKVYYEIKGKGSPILFIHGLGSSTLDWEKQIPVFAKHYKTITMDLRGHGCSDSAEGDYTMKQFAADTSALVEEEKESVHIVGISMGGMIAFQMAVDKPQLVKSLCIINSFSQFPMNVRKNRRAIRIRKLIPRIFGMKLMGSILGKKLFPNPGQEHLQKLMAQRWAKNNIKDYLKSVNAIAGWTVEERLSEIKCPVLVIASELDYMDIEEKKAYTAKLADARLVEISGAHHAVSMEKPEEVNKTLSDFLRQI